MMPVTSPFFIMILIQLTLDVILLFAIFLIYRKLRSLTPERIDSLLKALSKSENLCRELERNITEKGEIVHRFKKLMENSKAHATEASLRSRVLSLREQGASTDDISRQTGLSKSEVELAIALSKTRP